MARVFCSRYRGRTVVMLLVGFSNSHARALAHMVVGYDTRYNLQLGASANLHIVL